MPYMLDTDVCSYLMRRTLIALRTVDFACSA